MSPVRFVQWISEGRPVVVFGDGMQRRDFEYIDDIARGTIAGLNPLGHEIVNLGTDQPLILMAILRLVEALVGCHALLEFGPQHPADVPATWANIDKARAYLGGEPRVAPSKECATLWIGTGPNGHGQ